MKKLLAVLILICILSLSGGICAVGAEGTDPSDAYTHIDAQYEDSGLKLWFDYATEKISPDVTESTGMESFSVYMAKNEIENAQLVLSSENDMEGLNIKLGGFENENGESLSCDVFIQLYHDCGSFGYVPDAIPPLSAYGDFSLSANTSQAFLVKITTEATTESGWYSSDLWVVDAEGREIKYTKIFVYVWDFALSEATACATSINLDYGYLKNLCAAGDDEAALALYKNYYDYLLENRVSAYYLPYQLHKTEALEYMDNPRVTSFQYASPEGSALNPQVYAKLFTSVFAGEENAHRFNKAYYFANVVDADSPEDLEALRSAYDSIVSTVSKYDLSYTDEYLWFISSYIFDIDYTTPEGNVIDQIDYYDDFVNLLCSKTFAYTGSEELSTPGSKVLQPLKWNSVYGTFKERMASFKADGNKLWWFISWDVEAPYINYYMQTDGVLQRILFWQQYDNGVEGFLYNFANFWAVDGRDPYKNNITNSAYPNAHGESILIYPGNAYGLDIPVGSLRLEAMRDGIEDYQLFYMLDSMRNNLTDPIIDRMTTGMVTYSSSDKDYYEARIALGNAVEKASAGICDHVYELSEELSFPVSCTENGKEVYVCAYCGDSYENVVPSTGHSYGEDHVCDNCNETDPASQIKKGDLDGDGQVVAKDLNIIKKSIGGQTSLSEKQNLAADINNDGTVTAVDMNRILRYIAGLIMEL
ncbi:MAG: DUF4091 domain-containing protein [Ruminococcaceae bacterium]|nr:DUF4091 domain-containing protein [Oscillospiraceae bacterium]